VKRVPRTFVTSAGSGIYVPCVRALR
jgi:hypothetical protein